MSNRKKRAPLCTDTRKDGSPCNSYAREEGRCAYHLNKRAAQEAMQQTATPPPVLESGELEEEAELSRVVDNVRAELARDVGEHYGEIVAGLFGALKASKVAYTSCPECNKRHPVNVPDWTARVKAFETLLNQGFGRPSDETKKDARESFEELGLRSPVEMSDAELKAVLVHEYLADPDLLDAERGLQEFVKSLETTQLTDLFCELVERSSHWQAAEEERKAAMTKWQKRLTGERLKGMSA